MATIAASPRAQYRGDAAARLCPDCRGPVQRPARYCGRDRARRRALTFLYQALRVVDGMDDAHEARNGINRAIGALEAPAT